MKPLLKVEFTGKLIAIHGDESLEARLEAPVALRLSKLERVLGIESSARATSTTIVSPEDIPISEERAYGHPLQHLINKTSPICRSEVKVLLRALHLQADIYETGTLPAGLNPASDYFVHSWTRDAAIVAYAFSITHHTGEAARVIQNLACFYGRSEQRGRFIGFHLDKDPVRKYRFGHPKKELPHIRARIDQTGSMVESEDEWSHSQLDAIGMWLYVTFFMANRGDLDLSRLDDHVTAQVNSENYIDSILSVALRFLLRIKFWDQHDHGAWEDRLEPARASSVGACLAALKEALIYFTRYGWNSITICNPAGGPSLEEEISAAIEEATEAFERRIPRDGSRAIETERFPSDSAFTFLLFPFNPGLNVAQQRAILRALYSARMGEIGFTRRDTDEYLGMDHAYNPSCGSFCDPTVEGYRAAEWTLFDPLLAGYYYNRYIASTGTDEQCFLLADRHLKRSLCQVTSAPDRYVKAYDGREVIVPSGRIPEAYWWDTRLERWRANENSPLLMAEAACAMMLERAIEATRLWELRHRVSKASRLTD